MFSMLFASISLLVPNVLPLNEAEQLQTGGAESQYIYMVRHGESLFNIPDENGMILTSGKSLTVPLTEKGKEQARAFARNIVSKIPHDKEVVILSSTAKRAQETASCIFEELSPHFKVSYGKSYDGLLELGNGRWEGLPKDKVYEQDLKKWEDLSAQNKLVAPKVSTGESYQEVIERGLAALQEIHDDYHGKIVIVVSHFVTMNALAIRLNDAIPSLSSTPASKIPMVVLDNCDMLRVEIPHSDVDKAKVTLHYKIR